MNVTVKLAGTLVARTGTHRATVAVEENATLADVIDELAKEHGPQVRGGVLDGEHLRSDTIVVREAPNTSKPLTTHSPVKAGDVVRFKLNV